MIGQRYPAVVVHGLADVRSALALRRPLTLLSGAGAALYAGSGWWRALVALARAEHDGVSIDDILDCGDASGLALGALRIGQRILVLTPDAPGWTAVAAIAKSLDGVVFTSRPPALDMAARGSARRLGDWLHLRSGQGDSGGGLS